MLKLLADPKKLLFNPKVFTFQNLSLWFQFEQVKDGKVFDWSGNGLDGIVYGATQTYTKKGSALSFDGIDDYVEVPTDPKLETSKFSVEAIFMLYTLPFDKGEWTKIDKHGDGYKGWALGVRPSDNQFCPHLGDGVDWILIQSNVYAEVGKWYHNVITYDGEFFKVYIDGFLKGVIASSYIFSPKPFRIAIPHNWPAHRMHGQVALIRIYSRVLSEAEIREHYNPGILLCPKL